VTTETFRSNPTWIQFTPGWESAPSSPSEIAAVSLDKTVPIVIAEDDPVSREVISAAVSKWGFRSIVTQDGHEAMAAIRAEQGPVVAILDWMMPGMDGLEVCRRVRESGKRAHIILLTARAAKESLVEGLESGADDYLVKPFDKNELLARVKVGLRVLGLETSLANRVKELESALSEIHDLKLQVPL
jgi:DNA-binding response OmpR family regulator